MQISHKCEKWYTEHSFLHRLAGVVMNYAALQIDGEAGTVTGAGNGTLGQCLPPDFSLCTLTHWDSYTCCVIPGMSRKWWLHLLSEGWIR